jgi:outer membrane protein OmpA-like peptidoglycan-associated protein
MRWVFALAIAALAPVVLGAQVTATSSAKFAANDPPSKWDIFVGYSYLSPKGTVGLNDYQNVDFGSIASIAHFFNKNVGVQLEGDEHMESEDWPPGSNTSAINSNGDFAGGSGGLILRFPTANITPWVHALGGGERVGSLYQFETWGWVVTAGGGLDIETPWLQHRLAYRLVQADYQYASVNFLAGSGGTGTFNIARLSTGLVFHLTPIAPPPPVTLACSASPASIFPGDPVTVTATAGNLNPKLKADYSWTGSGVTGSGTTVNVATGSLPAGFYTVKGSVKEGKADKPWEMADCTASFTVKAYEPPTISCTANPSTIKPGDTSTITSVGMSPQNRPLTYSYSASAGTVSGSGATVAFNSAGAATGAVEITCNVSDDKGQAATANTTVTITAPYVPPVPHTQALCSIAFEKDKLRPARVDNEAKACLDEVALDLEKQPDAKAVVVGEATIAENAPKKGKHAKVEDLAAQRAVNTKAYLVTEKGIDASRISVATGATNGKAVEDYLVPSGADFSADVTGTTPVDETVVKPQVRKPLGAAPAHTKKPVKAATAAPAAKPAQ